MSDSVPRCAGCGYTHSYCTSQQQALDLLHQLYGAVRNEIGVAEALADIESWLG